MSDIKSNVVFADGEEVNAEKLNNFASDLQIESQTKHAINGASNRDPQATDDASSGYSLTSKWLNTETGILWHCTKNDTGNATWEASPTSQNISDLSTRLDSFTASLNQLSTTYSNNLTEIEKNLDEKISTNETDIKTSLQGLYPVGSILINADNNTNPSESLGFGTWEAFGGGKVLVGIDTNVNPDEDFATAGKTGGAKTHTLAKPEMPSHTHTTGETGTTLIGDVSGGGGRVHPYGDGLNETGSTGDNQPHNNLQPYIVVYMWKRTN